MESNTSYSPSVKKDEYPQQMSFYSALMDIANNKKVTKLEWNNKEEYGFMKNEILSIHRAGKDHSWLVSLADISGEDWVRLEDNE